MEDVYVVVMEVGIAGSVTICAPAFAERTIRQLRSGGRRVKVFRERDKYLQFLNQNAAERRRQIALQQRSL